MTQVATLPIGYLSAKINSQENTETLGEQDDHPWVRVASLGAAHSRPRHRAKRPVWRGRSLGQLFDYARRLFSNDWGPGGDGLLHDRHLWRGRPQEGSRPIAQR